MHIFSFYHWLSRLNPPIPHNVEDWPIEWRILQRKTYDGAQQSRFETRGDESLFATSSIQKLLRNRRSWREYHPDLTLSENELSTLLSFGCGETGDTEFPHRTYPSGGARYPIEQYVYLRKSIGRIKAGCYHYRSDIHALEEVHLLDGDSGTDAFFGYEWAKEASGAVFLTAVFSRSTNKYSERGYRYVLLEAGHISQNLLLVGEAIGLRTTALGGTRDPLIESFLGIDGHSESLVHTVIFGK